MEVVGVLQQQLVDVLPGQVGFGRFREAMFTILRRVYIGVAAWKQDSLASRTQLGDRGRIER